MHLGTIVVSQHGDLKPKAVAAKQAKLRVNKEI